MALCLVFAKPPRVGAVKTRIAATLGAPRATQLAAALLRDTWAAVSALPAVRPVLSTPAPHEDHGVGDAEAWDQGQGDLGARVERGLREGLHHAQRVLAIGADGVGVPPQRYLEAIEALEHADAVIGPSEDGGFYLLGVTRCPQGLLADLPWSAPDTFVCTVARLRECGFQVVELPMGWDVDREQDLKRLRRDVPRSLAPETHRVLDELGWPAP